MVDTSSVCIPMPVLLVGSPLFAGLATQLDVRVDDRLRRSTARGGRRSIL